MAFEDVIAHESEPTIPLTEIQKVRFSQLAEDLKDTRIQAYIEANFGIQALNLLKAVVAMIVPVV